MNISPRVLYLIPIMRAPNFKWHFVFITRFHLWQHNSLCNILNRNSCFFPTFLYFFSFGNRINDHNCYGFRMVYFILWNAPFKIQCSYDSKEFDRLYDSEEFAHSSAFWSISFLEVYIALKGFFLLFLKICLCVTQLIVAFVFSRQENKWDMRQASVTTAKRKKNLCYRRPI